jgi:hypothetical protein
MVTGGVQYSWAGPNNFSSTSKNISISNATINNAGTYYCTITDDTKDTTIIMSMTVVVLSRQVSSIVCESIICEHSDLGLSTTSGGSGALYLWTDQNSSWTSTAAAPTYSNIQGIGTHVITCEITYQGNTTTETSTVEVLDCCTSGPATLLHNINISAAPSVLLPTVVLLGTVTIDIDYTFPNNSEIIVMPFSYVEINSSKKLTVNSSIIRGCPNSWMWYGIYLNDFSTIDIANSTIRDGYNAILVEGAVGPVIKLFNNHFNDNGNSIFISGTATADVSYFFDNEFQSANYLLPWPLSGLPAFSGIYTANSLLQFPSTDRINFFHDMENGIVAMDKSDITIPKMFARFYNFNTTYLNSQNPGHGIYAEGPGSITKFGRNLSTFPDFKDCIEGIELVGCDALIEDNYMEGMRIGVRSNLGTIRKININSNSIFARTYGVMLNYNDPVYEVSVENNSITLNAVMETSSNACILINEGLNPPITNGFERIALNELQVNNGAYGIKSTGSNGTEITENIVFLNQPTYNLSGISLSVCENNIVSFNAVEGPGAALGNTTTLTPQGLTVESTLNSLYKCNSFNELIVGAGFYENCNPSRIMINHFNNHYVGLYYNKNAVTGDQNFMCNSWTGSYGSLKARHDGPQNIVTQSIFYVNTVPSDLDPVPMVTPPNIWFLETQGSGAIMECTGGGGEKGILEILGSSLTSVDSTMAIAGLPYEIYETPLQWTDGRSLLAKLSENPAITANNLLMQNFSDSVQQVSLGMFRSVESLKEDLSVLSPITENYLNNLNSEIQLVKDSLIVLDSVLYGGVGVTDSVYLMIIQNNLKIVLNTLNTDKENAIKGYRLIIDGKLPVVMQENNLLPSFEIFEENEKTVNSIYLATIAKGHCNFSSSQKNDLINISMQCSLAGGKAVLFARSMYSLISDTAFNDRDICLQNGIIKSSQTNNQEPDDFGFDFYPNPSSDFLILTWNNMEEVNCELYLVNTEGKAVSINKFSLNGGSKQFDIKSIPSGVYFAQIKMKGANINLGKILIAK